MGEIKDQWQKLWDQVNDTEPDILKLDQSGNKAAARRARKKLQGLKEQAHALRKNIQDAVR